ISERHYKRMHIAEPVQEHETDEGCNEFTFNAFNISDNEESDDNIDDTFENIINSNNINSERWSENYIGEYDKRPYDSEVGRHDIHPADNILAKWKLLDLFGESLEAPVYIDSMIILLKK
ncbi:8807_t:CDS:2, partial [Funneliformis mosseae]